MPTASANAISSSKSSGTLRVDFYESGVGDTIIITFPDGGIGIVDAHPSRDKSRPEIASLIQGKPIHFVCLTHPHADHGVDLIPILRNHPVESFWHTTSNVRSFIYRIQETVNYPSEVSEFAAQMNRDWADFLIDLFGAVAERDIPRHVLRADIEKVAIAGVDVHVLAPEESIQTRFDDALIARVDAPKTRIPDTNLLSAVLALQFGPRLVLLGADALQENWSETYKRWRKKALPKACVVKIPHHGGEDTITFRTGPNRHTYLDMCERKPDARAVLFAGDRKHPHPRVYEQLRRRTEVFCLSNGLFSAAENPLNLRLSALPGARAVAPARVCQPLVSFELSAGGQVTVLAGISCTSCGAVRLAPTP
jgi:beta-lactamase superfamily II metal-dependent hydrolase